MTTMTTMVMLLLVMMMTMMMMMNIMVRIMAAREEGDDDDDDDVFGGLEAGFTVAAVMLLAVAGHNNPSCRFFRVVCRCVDGPHSPFLKQRAPLNH